MQESWGSLWTRSQTYLGLKGQGGLSCPRVPCALFHSKRGARNTKPASLFSVRTGPRSLSVLPMKKSITCFLFAKVERGTEARLQVGA